jgi:hypothetical protein
MLVLSPHLSLNLFGWLRLAEPDELARAYCLSRAHSSLSDIKKNKRERGWQNGSDRCVHRSRMMPLLRPACICFAPRLHLICAHLASATDAEKNVGKSSKSGGTDNEARVSNGICSHLGGMCIVVAAIAAIGASADG